METSTVQVSLQDGYFLTEMCDGIVGNNVILTRQVCLVIACDISSILKINVVTDHCETLGFAGTDKNKWQGGVLGRDGCVYCIPANGNQLCRISTDPSIGGETQVQLIGHLPTHADKWQGAATGKDGSLYFIPENGYRVMRVTPPEKPPVLIDGKLPENDVKIELM